MSTQEEINKTLEFAALELEAMFSDVPPNTGSTENLNAQEVSKALFFVERSTHNRTLREGAEAIRNLKT